MLARTVPQEEGAKDEHRAFFPPFHPSEGTELTRSRLSSCSQNIKGTTYKIQNDEIVLPDDPRGEAKIDSEGNLLGGAFPFSHSFLLSRPSSGSLSIVSVPPYHIHLRSGSQVANGKFTLSPPPSAPTRTKSTSSPSTPPAAPASATRSTSSVVTPLFTS
jgi:hypothetical protein